MFILQPTLTAIMYRHPSSRSVTCFIHTVITVTAIHTEITVTAIHTDNCYYYTQPECTYRTALHAERKATKCSTNASPPSHCQQNASNILTGWATVSLSKNSLLQCVTLLYFSHIFYLHISIFEDSILEFSFIFFFELCYLTTPLIATIYFEK
jgi:hypothetical protein